MDARIELVPGELEPSHGPKGFQRRRMYEEGTVRVAETSIAGLAASGWHHHGARIFMGEVVRGTLILEFGPGGKRSVRPGPTEFFRIPPRLVHRDVNPGTEEVRVLTISIGDGPATFPVDGPPTE